MNKEERDTIWKEEKKHTVKTQIMVNKNGIIIHKIPNKKGRSRHDYDIYKENHLVIPKQVVNVFDLGYLGAEKDYPGQLYLHYHIKIQESQIIQSAKRIHSATF